MAPTIPSRCRDCAHVWDGAGAVGLSGGAQVWNFGVTTRCPKCGGVADVSDGHFTTDADDSLVMLSGPDWSRDFIGLLRATLEQVIRGAPSDPIAPIEEVAPGLASDLRRRTIGWTPERVITLVSGILGILSFAGIDAQTSAHAIRQLMTAVADYIINAR